MIIVPTNTIKFPLEFDAITVAQSDITDDVVTVTHNASDEATHVVISTFVRSRTSTFPSDHSVSYAGTSLSGQWSQGVGQKSLRTLIRPVPVAGPQSVQISFAGSGTVSRYAILTYKRGTVLSGGAVDNPTLSGNSTSFIRQRIYSTTFSSSSFPQIYRPDGIVVCSMIVDGTGQQISLTSDGIERYNAGDFAVFELPNGVPPDGTTYEITASITAQADWDSNFVAIG